MHLTRRSRPHKRAIVWARWKPSEAAERRAGAVGRRSAVDVAAAAATAPRFGTQRSAAAPAPAPFFAPQPPPEPEPRAVAELGPARRRRRARHRRRRRAAAFGSVLSRRGLQVARRRLARSEAGTVMRGRYPRSPSSAARVRALALARALARLLVDVAPRVLRVLVKVVRAPAGARSHRGVGVGARSAPRARASSRSRACAAQAPSTSSGIFTLEHDFCVLLGRRHHARPPSSALSRTSPRTLWHLFFLHFLLVAHLAEHRGAFRRRFVVFMFVSIRRRRRRRQVARTSGAGQIVAAIGQFSRSPSCRPR